MSRQDQYQVTVTIDGTSLGVWDMFDGGDADSTETKYKPGGMGPEVSLGGSQTIDNVTVTKLYDFARDHETARRLLTRVGKAAASVSEQPLDVDGNPTGRPFIYTGKLKKVSVPKHDSNSSSAAVWALEISTEGTVG